MRGVMTHLGISLPSYKRYDSLIVVHQLNQALIFPVYEKGKGTNNPDRERHALQEELVLELQSVHGRECPLLWIRSASVCFSHLPDVTHKMEAPNWCITFPLIDIRCQTTTAAITLNFPEACSSGAATINYEINVSFKYMVFYCWHA